MSEPRVAVRGIVYADHHTLWLLEQGATPRLPVVWDNGLVVGQRDVVLIYTGIHTGRVMTSVEVYDGPPEQVDTADWDEVADVSTRSLTGRLLLKGPTVSSALAIPLGAPGHYRVRVQARGRDVNVDGVADQPVEHYHLTLWPGPYGPTTVYKPTDVDDGDSPQALFSGRR